jgi:hypothetical protein
MLGGLLDRHKDVGQEIEEMMEDGEEFGGASMSLTK